MSFSVVIFLVGLSSMWVVWRFLVKDRLSFIIYILIRTTEVIPLENGLLHPVIWLSNTREYGIFMPGVLTNQKLL
jgi:hypothetical protein